MPKPQIPENYFIPAAGGTKQFSVNDSIDVYNLIPTGGAVTLLANFEVEVSGTPTEGMYFLFNYQGNVSVGGYQVKILGFTFTDEEASGKYLLHCTYTNGAWDVKVIFSMDHIGYATINGNYIIAGTLSGTGLEDSTLVLGKIENANARGYAIRAGVGGVWERFNAVTSGNLLMGNGTDVVSQAVTGDVTISGSGVTTIGAGKVTQTMLAYAPSEYFQDELTISSAQLLALNATPLTIVANPGAGYHIEVTSATASMTFNSAAYATNTTLQLINTGADIAQLQDTAILLSTVNKITKFKDVTSATAGQTQILSNTALQVKIATGEAITGNSPIKVVVTYKIVQD